MCVCVCARACVGVCNQINYRMHGATIKIVIKALITKWLFIAACYFMSVSAGAIESCEEKAKKLQCRDLRYRKSPCFEESYQRTERTDGKKPINAIQSQCVMKAGEHGDHSDRPADRLWHSLCSRLHSHSWRSGCRRQRSGIEVPRLP